MSAISIVDPDGLKGEVALTLEITENNAAPGTTLEVSISNGGVITQSGSKVSVDISGLTVSEINDRVLETFLIRSTDQTPNKGHLLRLAVVDGSNDRLVYSQTRIRFVPIGDFAAQLTGLPAEVVAEEAQVHVGAGIRLLSPARLNDPDDDNATGRIVQVRVRIPAPLQKIYVEERTNTIAQVFNTGVRGEIQAEDFVLDAGASGCTAGEFCDAVWNSLQSEGASFEQAQDLLESIHYAYSIDLGVREETPVSIRITGTDAGGRNPGPSESSIVLRLLNAPPARFEITNIDCCAEVSSTPTETSNLFVTQVSIEVIPTRPSEQIADTTSSLKSSLTASVAFQEYDIGTLEPGQKNTEDVGIVRGVLVSESDGKFTWTKSYSLPLLVTGKLIIENLQSSNPLVSVRQGEIITNARQDDGSYRATLSPIFESDLITSAREFPSEVLRRALIRLIPDRSLEFGVRHLEESMPDDDSTIHEYSVSLRSNNIASLGGKPVLLTEGVTEEVKTSLTQGNVFDPLFPYKKITSNITEDIFSLIVTAGLGNGPGVVSNHTFSNSCSELFGDTLSLRQVPTSEYNFLDTEFIFNIAGYQRLEENTINSYNNAIASIQFEQPLTPFSFTGNNLFKTTHSEYHLIANHQGGNGQARAVGTCNTRLSMEVQERDSLQAIDQFYTYQVDLTINVVPPQAAPTITPSALTVAAGVADNALHADFGGFTIDDPNANDISPMVDNVNKITAILSAIRRAGTELTSTQINAAERNSNGLLGFDYEPALASGVLLTSAEIGATTLGKTIEKDGEDVSTILLREFSVAGLSLEEVNQVLKDIVFRVGDLDRELAYELLLVAEGQVGANEFSSVLASLFVEAPENFPISLTGLADITVDESVLSSADSTGIRLVPDAATLTNSNPEEDANPLERVSQMTITVPSATQVRFRADSIDQIFRLDGGELGEVAAASGFTAVAASGCGNEGCTIQRLILEAQGETGVSRQASVNLLKLLYYHTPGDQDPRAEIKIEIEISGYAGPTASEYNPGPETAILTIRLQNPAPLTYEIIHTNFYFIKYLNDNRDVRRGRLAGADIFLKSNRLGAEPPSAAKVVSSLHLYNPETLTFAATGLLSRETGVPSKRIFVLPSEEDGLLQIGFGGIDVGRIEDNDSLGDFYAIFIDGVTVDGVAAVVDPVNPPSLRSPIIAGEPNDPAVVVMLNRSVWDTAPLVISEASTATLEVQEVLLQGDTQSIEVPSQGSTTLSTNLVRGNDSVLLGEDSFDDVPQNNFAVFLIGVSAGEGEGRIAPSNLSYAFSDNCTTQFRDTLSFEQFGRATCSGDACR